MPLTAASTIAVKSFAFDMIENVKRDLKGNLSSDRKSKKS